MQAEVAERAVAEVAVNVALLQQDSAARQQDNAVPLQAAQEDAASETCLHYSYCCSRI